LFILNIDASMVNMDNRLKFKLFLSTQAGGLAAVTVVLFLIFLAGLGYAFYTDPMLARTLAGAFFANAFGGRAAGVGLCIAFKMNPLETIFYNLFFETLIVFFCYSLFLLSVDHYIKNRFLSKAMLGAEKNALKYQDVISRYGWLGVFLFVMIPLPATGPVAGSIIAYFLNFSISRNFICVLSGTLVAIIAWTLFFDFLSGYMSAIQGVLAVIGIIVAVYLAKFIRDWLASNKSVS